MITKGIITSIDLNGNTCEVRMPLFETAGNDQISGTATISNTPGSYNGYKVGDVVMVGFEDGYMSKPVILGKLYLGVAEEKKDPRGVINVESLTSDKIAALPADTKLTATIDSNVPNTTVPYSSLASVANGLNTLNTNFGQMDRFINNQFKSIIEDWDGNTSLIEQLSDRITLEVKERKEGDEELSGSILEIQNDKVSANVYNTWIDEEDQSKTYGFGWDLTDKEWVIKTYDSSHEIEAIEMFKVDNSGVTITGDLKLKGYPSATITRYARVPAAWYDTENPREGWTTTVGGVLSAKAPDCDNLNDIKNKKWTSADAAAAPSDAPVTIGEHIWLTAKPQDRDSYYTWKLTYCVTYEYNSETHMLDEIMINKDVACIYFISEPQEGHSGPSISRLKPPKDQIASSEVWNLAMEAKNRADAAQSTANKKSTTYYDDSDPKDSNVIKNGDCWFKTTGNNTELDGSPAKGELKQWVGNPSNDDSPGHWENIGGQIVANEITAAYINALNIEAKKITVHKGGDPDKPILFEADGVSSNTVSIAGFDAGNDLTGSGANQTGGPYIKYGTVGDGSNPSVLISPGYKKEINNLASGKQTWVFTAGNKFGIDANGNTYATNLTASGNIRAKSILIKDGTGSGAKTLLDAGYTSATAVAVGGFEVDHNSVSTTGKSAGEPESIMLFSGTNDNAIEIGGSGDKNDWAILAGNQFGVDSNGNLYATSANITGEIAANRGTIGALEITNNGLSTDYLSISEQSVYLGAGSLNLNNRVSIYSANDQDFIVATGEKDFILKNATGAGIKFNKATQAEQVTVNINTKNFKFRKEYNGRYVPYTDFRYQDFYFEFNWDVKNGSGGAATLLTSFSKTLTFVINYDRQYYGGPITYTYTLTIPPSQSSGSISYKFATDIQETESYSAKTISDGSSTKTWNNSTSFSWPHVSIDSTNKMLYSLGSFAPVDATTSGTGFLLGNDSHVWGTIRAYTAAISTSDRREKDNIKLLSSDNRYSDFFDTLQPASFTLKHGDSGRTHTGFIAQDIQAGLAQSGLTTKEFAGFCIGTDENNTLALRYEEFIALNTDQIQKLKTRVSELESEIIDLKSKIK